ncbi:MAG: hypothetical protein ISR76_03480 [Planctomycetes bacterium]|nr:hypothetical protein [Planctomycetota bacterium]MBL7008032.1 hypothetical protein [Planctomycetota bacterium]
MLALLRQLARALTGKVDALEFTLGIFFGILLGVIPSGAVDPGTGFLGGNGLWQLVLVAMLVVRSSIPIAVLFYGLGKLLGILFLDAAAAAFGESLIESAAPQGLVLFFYESLPSWQLHTYWGMGGAILGFATGAVVFVPVYLVMKKRLPAWRERVGESKLAKALAGFVLFRFLGWLLR